MARSSTISLILLFLAIAFIFTSSSDAQDLGGHGKKVAGIQGDIFQACLAAYTDFSKILKEYSENPSETTQILSKLENYNIEISDKGDTYFVRFGKDIKKFPYIRGGGPMDYVVDKRTYEILKKEQWR